MPAAAEHAEAELDHEQARVVGRVASTTVSRNTRADVRSAKDRRCPTRALRRWVRRRASRATVASAERASARAATARGSGSCAFTSACDVEPWRPWADATARARHDAPSIRCRGAHPPRHGRGRRHPRPRRRARPVRARRARHAGAGRRQSHPGTHGSAGPAPAYRCTFNVNTDAFTGAHGTASAIGWLGDHNSVITCLGGTFVVQDGPGGLFQDYGFGIYEGQRTTWADAGGFLPAQVTTFDDQGATVSITEFTDRVVLGGAPYVAVYSRVRVDNPTGHTVTADPAASSALVPLDTAPDRCRPVTP